MAHLTDIDNVAPADSLKAGADVLNTWRTRIDALNDVLGNITSVEADQIEAIGTSTISVAQWGYLGACTAAGGALLDDADASAQRTTLGLVIGTNVQAYDAELVALAGLTSAADKLPYFTGSGAAAVTTLSSYMRGIIDDADEATFKVSVNLEIGTDVQAYDADLSAIAALANTDSNFIVGNGSAWVVETGATARTSLGLGSMAIQAHTSVNIDGGTIDGITDLAIADGGTGSSTAANARTALGLAIGSNVLAYDAGLSNLAGISMAADKFYYTSADNTHVAGTITAFGRSIIDDADEATFKGTVNLEIGTDVLAQQTIGIADNNLMEVDDTDAASTDYARFTATGLQGRDATEVKSDLGLVIGTNVQAYDAQLANIAALAVTDGNFIVGDGNNWVAESGTTALVSLGLVTELDNLTSGEVGQLEAIGTTTIDATQWGALGALVEWTDWTPTLTGDADLSGYDSARYYRIGDLCFYAFRAEGKNVTSAGHIEVTLPFTAANEARYVPSSRIFDSANYVDAHILIDNNTDYISIYKNVGGGNWAGNEINVHIFITGFFEIA